MGLGRRLQETARQPIGHHTGRIVLGEAPSNTDVIYALYVNGDSGNIEADLWKYDLSTDTWTDYSSKIPDEPEMEI